MFSTIEDTRAWQFLESLLDLLEQHLQLEDFDVDNNPEGEHVVRLSVG